MNDVKLILFSKHRHSRRMKRFFFRVSLLTLLGDLDVLLDCFVKIVSSVTINNSLMCFFFVAMIIFIVKLFQNQLLFFKIINDSFQKNILRIVTKKLIVLKLVGPPQLVAPDAQYASVLESDDE